MVTPLPNVFYLMLYVYFVALLPLMKIFPSTTVSKSASPALEATVSSCYSPSRRVLFRRLSNPLTECG